MSVGNGADSAGATGTEQIVAAHAIITPSMLPVTIVWAVVARPIVARTIMSGTIICRMIVATFMATFMATLVTTFMATLVTSLMAPLPAFVTIMMAVVSSPVIDFTGDINALDDAMVAMTVTIAAVISIVGAIITAVAVRGANMHIHRSQIHANAHVHPTRERRGAGTEQQDRQYNQLFHGLLPLKTRLMRITPRVQCLVTDSR